MQGNQNYEKHACQNTVAMETSTCLGQGMSYQMDLFDDVAQNRDFSCFSLKQ